ncbi:ROK family protein [bacterium]|nr:ROK family protein [bacterium]
MKTTAYLAIDAGGTYLKSAVLEKAGAIVDGSAFSNRSFSDGTCSEILEAFHLTFAHGLSVIRERGMHLGGIGIAIPGPFDYDRATPLMKHKFKSIYGHDLRSAFRRMPGIAPELPIRFTQDANAILAGEIAYGNARGFGSAAVATLGTGLGFAISERGKVLCNPMGGPFYSIFRIPYKDGILEDYTAKEGIIRNYRRLCATGDTDGMEVSDIGRGADSGDIACIHAFGEVGTVLGESLRDILLERNTECLLLGGQIARSFLHMEKPLREALKQVNSLQRIARVKNIDHAALIGVHAVLLQNEQINSDSPLNSDYSYQR